MRSNSETPTNVTHRQRLLPAPSICRSPNFTARHHFIFRIYSFFTVFIPEDLCAGIIKSYRIVWQTNSFSIFTRGIFSQALNAHRLRTIYGEVSQMNA